jgi:enoyl-[acyl-carrier protein] reductase II
MGTRMLSCAESPVHANWKQAVLNAAETHTVFLNQESRPALRALRTGRTAALALVGKFNVMEHMADLPSLYFGGDMEAAIPLCGQVCGRIDSIKTAREIVEETMAGFHQIVRRLAKQYVA